MDKKIKIILSTFLFLGIYFSSASSVFAQESSKYTLHFSKENVVLDIYANIITAGIHVNKSNINPNNISAKYKESSSNQWSDSHYFVKVENGRNNLATLASLT